jgi:hypothetical protein
MLFDDRHGFTALQAVQSRSFAFMYDVGWSLRRAGGVQPLTGLCGRRTRFSIDMQPLTGLYILSVIPFCLILIIPIRNDVACVETQCIASLHERRYAPRKDDEVSRP